MSQQIPRGCETLVAGLDEAVASAGGDSVAATGAVKEALVRLCEAGLIELSAEIRQPVAGSYARRLIHHNRELNYTALAMVWGPGQGTPLHDHNGLWCVECVVQGRIDITAYGLLEASEKLYQFDRQETVSAGVGSAGQLIPPFDYHTIANALEEEPSVTIHVYGGEMTRCAIFEPRYRNWYEKVERELALTA